MTTRDWCQSRQSDGQPRPRGSDDERSGQVPVCCLIDLATHPVPRGVHTMARISCLLLAVGLVPLSSCLRLNVGDDAATMRPAVSSDDTTFGSVKLSEAGEWSYESGHVAGAQCVCCCSSNLPAQVCKNGGVSPHAQVISQREPLAGSVARGSFKDAVHTPQQLRTVPCGDLWQLPRQPSTVCCWLSGRIPDSRWAFA